MKAKTKIAILIDWYLPGTKAGGPVRSIYSLLSLLKNDFDLYLLTKNHDLGSSDAYTDVPSDVLFEKEGVHYYYFSRKNFSVPAIISQIRSVSPDLVYLNSLWSYHFSIGIIKAFKSGEIGMPVLLAPRGMLGKGAMSLKSFKKELFLFLASVSGLYKHVLFHATNKQEENDILRRFPKARIFLAPNLSSAVPFHRNRIKEKNHIRIFYLSRIAKVKNLRFAVEVLQDIPGQYRVEYDIFGNAEDLEYWNECRQLMSRLPSHIKVNHRGELKFHEVQETVSAYHALFLPTLNENFGHSIVESLMSGCLVLTSDQTPWVDLQEHRVGYALDLTKKKTFSESLISLAELGQQEFDEASKRAINYISAKLNIPQNVAQYKSLFDECSKNRSF